MSQAAVPFGYHYVRQLSQRTESSTEHTFSMDSEATSNVLFTSCIVNDGTYHAMLLHVDCVVS